MDQERRSVCIIAASDLVSVCYKALTEQQISLIVSIVLNQLGNQATRETALKGLMLICQHETSNLRSRYNYQVQPLQGLQRGLSQVNDSPLSLKRNKSEIAASK